MFEMSRLPTPIICVVIGEGGSGGALGIGVGDRVAMLEHAYYSVISPEGCAGILWKSHTYKEQAAQALRMTSRTCSGFGVHRRRDRRAAGRRPSRPSPDGQPLKLYLVQLRELLAQPLEQLLESRYQKFRRMGVFFENAAAAQAAQAARGEHPGDVPELPYEPDPATMVAETE